MVSPLVVSPLVETKLFIPKVRSRLLGRSRLSEKLSRVTQSRLALISAPAGFGKTTLLAEWVAGASGASASGTRFDPARTRLVAWLSLDESDRPPAVFWPYLVAALQAAVPGLGAEVLPLLQSGQVPITTALATVVNELTAVEADVVLVLDDYHLADGPDIQEGMVFLLDRLPPHVHLIIATRADPALPLARLRSRGELIEIRSAELRFTIDEAAAYLNDSAGLALAAGDIAVLEDRTEGWIAALQLAALSIQGRDDIAGFIAGFAGDDRYIVDYLAEEVLSRLPPQTQAFLVQTSILDRLSGPLCDAITGLIDGRATLESINRANLFVIPLDDNRRWYRYHHLFADVLRTRLLDEHPDRVNDLHRRASRWFEENGEPARAIGQALAAGDLHRVADLAELSILELQKTRQENVIREWLRAIPEDLIRARPVLAVASIGVLMSSGEFAGIDERLNEAERWLPPADDPGWTRPDGMIVADERELARLPAAIAMYRAALALIRGDPAGTVRQAELAISRALEGDHIVLAAASALSGLAHWSGGDLEKACGAYSISIDGLQQAGHIADVLGCSIAVGDIQITQGRLDDAQRTYEAALHLAEHEPGPALRGTADMYVGLSMIAAERNDIRSAERHLMRAREFGEHTWLPQNPYRWRVAMARVAQAQGDLDGALGLLDEAQAVYDGDFSPDVRPVAASRARVLIALGRLPEADAWAKDRGVSVDDDLSYLREFEHIILARLLLAHAAAGPRNADPAALGVVRLLEGLLRQADSGGRAGNVIEILVLQALTAAAGGDPAGALAPLERALTLAEPERYIRVFADEGLPMAALLTRLAGQRSGSGYARELLDACVQPVPGKAPVAGSTGADEPSAGAVPNRQKLVEPLSERELDVLRLLGSDLSGPDMARALSVSLNTLRTHTKSIYAKLGVNSRRAAVRQAAELNLLAL